MSAAAAGDVDDGSVADDDKLLLQSVHIEPRWR